MKSSLCTQSILPGDLTEENKQLWTKFIEKAISHEDYLKFMKEANDWLRETNSPVRLDGRYVAYTPSPYLNVYNFPKELDYAKMQGNWVRMDSVGKLSIFLLFQRNIFQNLKI